MEYHAISDVTQAFRPRDDDISYMDSSDDDQQTAQPVKRDDSSDPQPEALAARDVIECLHTASRVRDWLLRKANSTTCVFVSTHPQESVASALRRFASLENVQTQTQRRSVAMQSDSLAADDPSPLRKTSVVQLCDKTDVSIAVDGTDITAVTSSQAARTCSHSSADSGRGDTASSFSESGISANSHATLCTDELTSPPKEHAKRRHHRTMCIDDIIVGRGKRKYRVRDIIDSVDELIGSYFEDAHLSDLDTTGSSRSSLTSQSSSSFIRKASARLSDVNLLRRVRDAKSMRKTVSFNLQRDKCGRSTCCNCQEERSFARNDVIMESAEDSEATLDCYSRAHTKRLQVETFCRNCKTRAQKQSTSSAGSDDVTTSKVTTAFARDLLRRSRTLLQLPLSTRNANTKMARHTSDSQVRGSSGQSRDAESIDTGSPRTQQTANESHYFSDSCTSSLKKPPLPHTKSKTSNTKSDAPPAKSKLKPEPVTSRPQSQSRVVGRRAMRQKVSRTSATRHSDVTATSGRVLETAC